MEDKDLTCDFATDADEIKEQVEYSEESSSSEYSSSSSSEEQDDEGDVLLVVPQEEQMMNIEANNALFNVSELRKSLKRDVEGSSLFLRQKEKLTSTAPEWLSLSGFSEYLNEKFPDQDMTMDVCIRAIDTKRQVEVYIVEQFRVSRKFVSDNMIRVYSFHALTQPASSTTKPGKHFHEFAIHCYTIPIFLYKGTFTEEEAKGLSYGNMEFAVAPFLTESLKSKVDEVNKDNETLDMKNLVSIVSKVLSNVSRRRIEKLFEEYKEEEEETNNNEQKTLQHTKKFKQIYDVFLSDIKKI